VSLPAFVSTISNTYERKARLYPALIAALPALGIAVLYYGAALDLQNAGLALLASTGGSFLLTNIARESGKRLEQRLFDDWGGMPTTQLQRHRDITVDPVTKQSRHACLATALNVAFPTREQEEADPRRADDIYSAGAAWLRERTRERTRFPLVFQENVEYGFRRNGLGLKAIGIAVSLGAIFFVLVSERVVTWQGVQPYKFPLGAGANASLLLSAFALFAWLFFFTRASVRTAAFAYASALLRACSSDLLSTTGN
jgi:hypothetical protein